jgi:hypothetical protein
MGGVKDDDHMIPVGEMARPPPAEGNRDVDRVPEFGLAEAWRAVIGPAPAVFRASAALLQRRKAKPEKACSDISPGLAEKPQTLLRYAGVHGVFMSEFRPTAHDCVSNVTRRV